MVEIPFQFKFVLTEIVTECIPEFVRLRIFTDGFGSHDLREAFAVFRVTEQEPHGHGLRAVRRNIILFRNGTSFRGDAGDGLQRFRVFRVVETSLFGV